MVTIKYNHVQSNDSMTKNKTGGMLLLPHGCSSHKVIVTVDHGSMDCVPRYEARPATWLCIPHCIPRTSKSVEVCWDGQSYPFLGLLVCNIIHKYNLRYTILFISKVYYT